MRIIISKITLPKSLSLGNIKRCAMTQRRRYMLQGKINRFQSVQPSGIYHCKDDGKTITIWKVDKRIIKKPLIDDLLFQSNN